MTRLQKYIAECGICSRRAAEELIEAGKVTVNGEKISKLGAKVDPLHDLVRVRGKIIKPDQKGLVIFNKPRGVVSTLSDPGGRKTVADYLVKELKSYFPVGRLDQDSSGLLLLTNDGELADRLLHPRYAITRIYHIRVEGHPTPGTIAKVQRGIKLEDGMASATLQPLRRDEKTSWHQITISEGRNRLVRRLMLRVGYPVIKLRRVSHGPLKLGKLKPGSMRMLSPDEFQRIKRKIFTK
jgi:23S rRNA pseudouridine2605 synthase